jgi:hypothetical protein
MASALPAHKPRSMADACNALQFEATTAIAPIPILPKDKKLAFVAAGWTFVDGVPDAQPTVALITNALKRTGWQDKPSNEFWIDGGGIPDKAKFLLLLFGQPVDRRRYLRAFRGIRRGLHAGNSYKFVMEQMVTFALNTARHNRAVGSGLNVVSLPRPPREQPDNFFAMYGIPDTQGLRFLSVPDGGVQYGPNCICGSSSVTGVKAGFGPPPCLSDSSAPGQAAGRGH